jgi:uncharacterized protein (DUF983 family)
MKCDICGKDAGAGAAREERRYGGPTGYGVEVVTVFMCPACVKSHAATRKWLLWIMGTLVAALAAMAILHSLS